jgi:hypothetical protein
MHGVRGCDCSSTQHAMLSCMAAYEVVNGLCNMLMGSRGGLSVAVHALCIIWPCSR